MAGQHHKPPVQYKPSLHGERQAQGERQAHDTLPARFFANASRLGNRTAHYYLIAGEQYPVGWSTMARVVRDLSAGLVEIGHEHGDRIAIVSEPRREWLYWDLACMSVAGVTVCVHAGLDDHDINAALAESGARYCVVDSEHTRTRIRRAELPCLELVIVIESNEVEADGRTILTQAELRRLASRGAHHAASERLDDLTGADAATFVFTDATTDVQCASMFSHAALVAAVDAVSAIGVCDDDVGFSYLPLANSMQRVLDYVFVCGATPWCYAADGSLADAELIQPSIVVVDAVALEYAYEAVYDFAKQLPVPAERLLGWARSLGRATVRQGQGERASPGRLTVSLEMVRRMLLDRVVGPWGSSVRVLVCAGEPAARDIVDFFDAAGVPLLEVWGPAQMLGVATLNLRDARRAGTVGQVAAHTSLHVDGVGELIVNGENLFSGYYKRPNQTTAAFDSTGGLRTGVLGSVDADGFVTLRGSRRDLIVTATGLEVSPEPIERLLTADPRIRQAVVVGQGRASLAVLIGVSPALRERAPEADLFKQVEAIIAENNLELPRAEQLTDMRLLPYELTSASGELTPGQQLRRNVVVEKFSYLIDEMY